METDIKTVITIVMGCISIAFIAAVFYPDTVAGQVATQMIVWIAQ